MPLILVNYPRFFGPFNSKFPVYHLFLAAKLVFQAFLAMMLVLPVATSIPYNGQPGIADRYLWKTGIIPFALSNLPVPGLANFQKSLSSHCSAHQVFFPK